MTSERVIEMTSETMIDFVGIPTSFLSSRLIAARMFIQSPAQNLSEAGVYYAKPRKTDITNAPNRAITSVSDALGLLAYLVLLDGLSRQTTVQKLERYRKLGSLRNPGLRQSWQQGGSCSLCEQLITHGRSDRFSDATDQRALSLLRTSRRPNLFAR